MMIIEPPVPTSAAASTLVRLMTSDAWGPAKSGVERLWRQFRPERTSGVSADLDDARLALLEARSRHDRETEAALVAEWEARFRRLVAGDAAAADALARLAAELRALSGEGRSGAVHMTATAHDNARIYQANRDQIIHG
jgi:hypothetical protein